ncbi:hypothetical protein [Rhodococcus pyridinivorans]|uniref:hypothetical protein n=1 Tax=Rhodococcus pyridinivorans TaxID=103816 RepID=UPI0039B4F7D7
MNDVLTLPWPPGFSLAASSRFVMDFAASQGGEDAPAINFAFALDRTWLPVSVRVAEHGEASDAAPSFRTGKR